MRAGSGDSAPANRAQRIARTIKDWIAERDLQPGDRLPQESQLIEALGVAKSTVREGLKVLEAQGLVRTRTGPGGGAFVTGVSNARAEELLANRFFFEPPTIGDVYALRGALEPLLARELALAITEERIESLAARMSAYEAPPRSIEEERAQRFAELDFHSALAELSANPLLRFVCGFLIRLLRDLAICAAIYERPDDDAMRESGVGYQRRLLAAFRARDPDEAEKTMAAHMRAAEAAMTAREAEIVRAWLDGDRAVPPTASRSEARGVRSPGP